MPLQTGAMHVVSCNVWKEVSEDMLVPKGTRDSMVRVKTVVFYPCVHICASCRLFQQMYAFLSDYLVFLDCRCLVSFADTVRCAEELFHDVLSRKDRADKMRNALNIMQRFRFLFSLPRNVEKNIKNVSHGGGPGTLLVPPVLVNRLALMRNGCMSEIVHLSE